MTDLKETAINAAHIGGKILVEGLSEKIKIDFKGEKNLVTQIDKRSEEAIINFIRNKYPGHQILAEEGGEGNESPSPYKWIIDPLDGTTNYAHGYPCFCVSIGIEFNGEIILGVVFDPMRDELFYAEKGKGSFLNNNQIHVSKTDNLYDSLLVTGFNYDIVEGPGNNFNYFQNFSLKTQGVRRTGSAAIDLCYVASGRFDGFWELKLSPWDVSAGFLIVTEAGGKVTGFAGNKYSIYSKEILATNGRIHEEAVKVLQS